MESTTSSVATSITSMASSSPQATYSRSVVAVEMHVARPARGLDAACRRLRSGFSTTTSLPRSRLTKIRPVSLRRRPPARPISQRSARATCRRCARPASSIHHEGARHARGPRSRRPRIRSGPGADRHEVSSRCPPRRIPGCRCRQALTSRSLTTTWSTQDIAEQFGRPSRRIPPRRPR